MGVKEKYDKIIAYVEREAANPYKKANEIVQELADRYVLDIRELNVIFRFMTGETARNYVVLRKIMAAYLCLISSKNLDIPKAISISGLENHSSFNKKFAEIFNMTPKEAFKAKDFSLFTEPLNWDAVSDNETVISPKKADDNVTGQSVFGVSKDQYEKMLQAQKLKDLYGLEQSFANVAFEFAEKNDLDLDEAFEYIEDVQDYLGDDNTDESFITETAENPLHLFMYFDCGLPIYDAYDLMDEHNLTREELLSVSPDLISAYDYYSGFSFKYFQRAYCYFMEHAAECTDGKYTEEDFDEFIKYLSTNMPIEEAFSYIIPSDMDYGCFTLEELQADSEYDYEFDMIEREAEENERWNGVRIDKEYDKENMFFDDEDY